MREFTREEQENLLGIFWTLLQVLEAEVKIGPESNSTIDELNKNIINSSYNFLNRIEFTPHRPRWENNGTLKKS